MPATRSPQRRRTRSDTLTRPDRLVEGQEFDSQQERVRAMQDAVEQEVRNRPRRPSRRQEVPLPTDATGAAHRDPTPSPTSSQGQQANGAGALDFSALSSLAGAIRSRRAAAGSRTQVQKAGLFSQITSNPLLMVGIVTALAGAIWRARRG